MIIAQVCLRLATIKGHPKMCNQSDLQIDCGLWNVGPLLFNGCAKLLDIGRNWNTLSYTPIQSIPNMLNGWHVRWVCWPSKNWDVFSFQELCTDPCNMGPCIIMLQHEVMVVRWGDGSEVRWWFRKPVSIWCDHHLPSPSHRVLWTIFEWNRPFVYIEKVLDLWVQLMKNEGKNKSVAFIFLFSVYIYCHLSFSRRFYPKWLTNEDNGSNQNQQKCNDMQVL